MVRQDIQTVFARAAERTQQEQEKQAQAEKGKSNLRRTGSGWQVVAVQSIACVVILLLALLMRTAGGSAYEQLRKSFNDSMMSNDLLATLAVLWDGDPLDALSSDPLDEDGETGVTANGITGSTTDAASDTTTTDSTTTTQTNAVNTTTAVAGVSDTDNRLPPQGMLAVTVRVTHPAASPLEEGRLTSAYGYRADPVGEGEQFHRGVDIAAPTGTPIASMFCGQVCAVGESDSLGRYICLRHGEVEVLYAHCAQVLASENAVVRAGETVALVGATGEATGSHVHIQVSVGGTVYNPNGVVPVAQYA